MRTAPRYAGALDRRRVALGYALAVGLPVAVALVLLPLRDTVNLVGDALLFVLAGAAAAYVGGMGPALVAAVAGSMLLNWFFTPPLYTLSIADPTNALALVVFVLVALLVASAVELAGRRRRDAVQAQAESDALAAVDRTRTALLAAVGHDLRTPLAAAKTSVSTLSADLPLSAEDRRELAAAAEESLDRLGALVENLLDMSRLRAGALAVTLRPVGVGEVVDRALRDPAVADEVRVDLPVGVPDLLADAGLLERVVVNVVANAVRHSPAGRPPVVTAARLGDDVVEVRVRDHGPGIPTEQRDAAFVPFQRLGDTDTTTGVGLGLALSRGLTEAMGGTLHLEDAPGGGLVAVLRLPAATPDATARPGLREREQA